VDQVLAEKPDLIVLLGDLVEGHGQIQGNIQAGFSRLKAPLGVWAIPGNHDRYGRGNIAEMLQGVGIELLLNRWTELQPGLVLAGIEDLYRRRRNLGFDPIERALENRPPGATILLSHAPEQVAHAAGSGADLMLCGHTHGGQIWPFGYLVKTRNPYLSGRYEVDGMPLIVCRGTGTWGPRMRLWPPGEILRITVRSSAFHSTK
jgi:predicted MPP superfamily phosphohydrolase